MSSDTRSGAAAGNGGVGGANPALEPLRIVAAKENNLRSVTVSLPKHKLVVVTGLSGSGKSSLIFDCLVRESQRQLIGTFSTFARQRLPKFDRPKVGAIHNMSTAIVVDQKRIGFSSRATVGTSTETFALLRLLFARLGQPTIGPSAYFSFNKPQGMCTGCQGIGRRLQPDIAKLVDADLTLATGAVRHPDYRVGGWLWKTLVVTSLFDMHLPLRKWSEEELCALLFSPKRAVPVDCDRRALMRELAEAAGAEMAKSPSARDELRRLLEPPGEGAEEAATAVAELEREEQDAKEAARASRKRERGKRSAALAGSARRGRAPSRSRGQRAARLPRSAASPRVRGEVKPAAKRARGAARSRAAAAAAAKTSKDAGAEEDRAGGGGGGNDGRGGGTDSEESVSEASAGGDDSDSSSGSEALDEIATSEDGVGTSGRGEEEEEEEEEEEDSGDEVMAASRFKRGGRSRSQGAVSAQTAVAAAPAAVKRAQQGGDAAVRKQVLAEMGFTMQANFEGVVTGVARRRLGRDDSGGDGKREGEFFSLTACSACGGTRLNERARSVRVNGKTLPELAAMEVWQLHEWVRREMGDMLGAAGGDGEEADEAALEEVLAEAEGDDEESEGGDGGAGGQGGASGAKGTPQQRGVARVDSEGDPVGGAADPSLMRRFAVPAVRNLERRLSSLRDVGVGYLTLSQSVASLSPGESQRVKLARQLRCDLVGLLYVLDEPTKGCHGHDIRRVVELARSLVARGNSVVAVDHSVELMAAADWIVEMGPGAGADGGAVVFEGPFRDMLASDASVTGRCLRGVLPAASVRALAAGGLDGDGDGAAAGPVPARQRREPGGWLRLRHANVNNLRDLDVELPRNVLCALTGLSGAGKSSLLFTEFLNAYRSVCVVIDQSSVGRTSRGCLATYAGAFNHIRKLFARRSGRPIGLFSFNTPQGACPKCKGAGQLDVEMSFLANVRVRCEQCRGRRFNAEALAVAVDGRSVADVLDLTVDQALQFDLLARHAPIRKLLALLVEVGLGYVSLGQRLTTLSGGEAQRLKLASELSQSGRVYLLDEPSTGLHMKDVARLLRVLARLVDNGNSVFVIEHNLQLVREADYVLDMGPGGGSAGGAVVARGTPEEVAAAPGSLTGRYLRPVLAQPWHTITP